jgi:hypothetical protein
MVRRSYSMNDLHEAIERDLLDLGVAAGDVYFEGSDDVVVERQRHPGAMRVVSMRNSWSTWLETPGWIAEYRWEGGAERAELARWVATAAATWLHDDIVVGRFTSAVGTGGPIASLITLAVAPDPPADGFAPATVQQIAEAVPGRGDVPAGWSHVTHWPAVLPRAEAREQWLDYDARFPARRRVASAVAEALGDLPFVVRAHPSGWIFEGAQPLEGEPWRIVVGGCDTPGVRSEDGESAGSPMLLMTFDAGDGWLAAWRGWLPADWAAEQRSVAMFTTFARAHEDRTILAEEHELGSIAHADKFKIALPWELPAG